MKKRRMFTKYDLLGMEYRAKMEKKQEPLADIRHRIKQESQQARQMAAVCNRNVPRRVPSEVAT